VREEVIVKFVGVHPSRMSALHALLDGALSTLLINPDNDHEGRPEVNGGVIRQAEMLQPKWDAEHDTYTVDIAITAAFAFMGSSEGHDNTYLVYRTPMSVLEAICNSVGWFPAEEVVVPVATRPEPAFEIALDRAKNGPRGI
jgi:hypothetical protein